MNKEIWFAKHDDGKYRNPDNWRSPNHEKHAYSSAAPVVDSKGKLVAYVCGATSSSKGFAAIDKIIEPRSRLIAAAPDLLKALKTLADRNITYWSEDGEVRSNFGSQQKAMEAFRLARAAIKKATGDEK